MAAYLLGACGARGTVLYNRHARTRIASDGWKIRPDLVSEFAELIATAGRTVEREACHMRPLHELIDTQRPAIHLIRKWAGAAENQIEILPPSQYRAEVLSAVQIAIDDPLGAIAYDTGGILIDHGWLRFLGSGHPKLRRGLAEWNRGRGDGFLLVADDAAGGFFAVNRGAWGDDASALYYWAPDNLDWEPVGFAFADFLEWSLTPCLADFYQHLRWPKWNGDVAGLGGDRCFVFDPPLWTEQGSVRKSAKSPVAANVAFDAKTVACRNR